MNETFNISIFTENRIGILNRITIIFTRRHLNIDSITASPCELEDVYRYTIVLKTTEKQIKKVVGQIEKQIDVLRAFYHRDEHVVYQELALYKLATKSFISTLHSEQIVREHQARILSIEEGCTTVEKTGRPEEIQSLFNALAPIGVLEFARSGRVVISKPMKTLEQHLEEQLVTNR
ncbi:MAG: acetolactate synthase-1/3 small subunit [Flavobacteriaceae bacterium]|jgi:acetolactate synthase-1/3 small subunit